MTKAERALALQEIAVAQCQIELGNLALAQNHLRTLQRLLEVKPRKEVSLDLMHDVRRMRKDLRTYYAKQGIK
jgi:cell division FtsZ-interacting protein ZapD